MFHAGRNASGLGVGLLLIASAAALGSSAFGQAGAMGTYLSMSHALASQFGRTWQRGQLCNLSLDGVSRRAAHLLFSRRLAPEQVDQVLTSFDEAARAAAKEGCVRKAVESDIQQADAQLRRSLQVPAPYRIQIPGQMPPARF
ncbi:MAG: hypothetical protein ACM30H_02375 [Clostridia bacterium]